MDKLVTNVYKISIKFRDGTSKGFTAFDWRIVGNTLILDLPNNKSGFVNQKMFPLDLIDEMNSTYEEVPVA